MIAMVLGPALAEWEAILGADNVITADPTCAPPLEPLLQRPSRFPRLSLPRIASRYRPVCARRRVTHAGLSNQQRAELGLRLARAGGGRLRAVEPGAHEPHRRLQRRTGLRHRGTRRHAGQLIEFLASRGSRLWADVSGSSAACSSIGNAMERGFGHTPYGDHASKVCGFEVVLPNGEVIEPARRDSPDRPRGPFIAGGRTES